jgi:hypothetical protein
METRIDKVRGRQPSRHLPPKTTHITRNLRHLEHCTNSIKEKAKDGTCILVKVASADNNSDIGTKRVPISILTKLTSQIVDRSLRNNLQLN